MGSCEISKSNGDFGGWRGRFVIFTTVGGGIVNVDIIKVRIVKIMSSSTFLNEPLNLMSMVDLSLFDTCTCGFLFLHKLYALVNVLKNDEEIYLLVLSLKRLDISFKVTLFASLTIEDIGDTSPSTLTKWLLILHCTKQDI